jgi:copper oxidase (laccase) domain-containing protein
MVANENKFRMVSFEIRKYHAYLKFIWHKQRHGAHVFHFLDILKSFAKCDTCINTYKFCLIAIVTSRFYYVYMF